MKRWAPEEDEILEKYYPTHGPSGCKKRLPGRSIDSIRCRAKTLRIRYGQHLGYLSVGEVARASGIHPKNVTEYAKKCGKKIGGRWMIPEGLAIEYIESRRRQREHSELRRAGYMSTAEAGKALSVSAYTIRNWIAGKSWLAKRFSIPRHFRGLGGAILINPYDIERVRTALDKERREARQMVSLKQVALDEGVDKTIARRRYADRRSIKTLINGRIVRFFDLQSGDD